MIRLISILSLALIISSAPGAFAGPACSKKHWKAADCVQRCGSKWGWSGRMMGTDPWGTVMQKSGDSKEAWDAALATACGAEITQPSPQPVANVQSESITFSSTSSRAEPSSSIFEAKSSTVNKFAVTATTATQPSITSTRSVPATSFSTSRATTKSSEPASDPSTTSTSISTQRTVTSPKFTSTTSKASQPTPAPSSGGSGETDSSDVQAYLAGHNSVRARHGAADLTWSNDLASKAQEWANGCLFKHSGGSLGPFGEDLAAGTGSSYDIQSAITSWTNEVSEYNPADPQASHFTQVVWKSTTQVGCAVQSCDGIFDATAKYYVCEYSPAGNVNGEFAENVQV